MENYILATISNVLLAGLAILMLVFRPCHGPVYPDLLNMSLN